MHTTGLTYALQVQGHVAAGGPTPRHHHGHVGWQCRDIFKPAAQPRAQGVSDVIMGALLVSVPPQPGGDRK